MQSGLPMGTGFFYSRGYVVIRTDSLLSFSGFCHKNDRNSCIYILDVIFG